MKSKLTIIVCIMVICAAIMSFLVGCFDNGDDGSSTPSEPSTYTIQYTDDTGTHTIEVKDGDPFSIEAIPVREGYKFVGLFDAESGGKQYVSANGSSLQPFTDKKNIVLFPQYTPNEYIFILDYGDAEVVGERQITAKFGLSLPELPTKLSMDHYTFSGWYTQPECKGVKIADSYGLVPKVSIVNGENFDLNAEYITLYAGFEIQKFSVTLNFGDGIQSQIIKVGYNTPISQIVPDVRNNRGEAVLTWSKTQGGSDIFKSNITEDTVLYAVEWAPVIELDVNGGEEVVPVVAKAGSLITLPVPVRENYKFMGWQNSSGEITELSTMPSGGAELTAKWQAMIVFDENGGSEVSDISLPSGSAVTLPTPVRNGYVFAGWYTQDKTEYETSSMPASGIALKAGWYKKEVVSKTIIAGDDSLRLNGYKSPTTQHYQILLSSLVEGLDVSVSMDLNVKLTFSTQHEVSTVDLEKFNPSISCTLSRSATAGNSDTYLSTTFGSNYVTTWQNREMEADITVNEGVFYIIFKVFNEKGYVMNANVYVTDFKIEITYPDTSVVNL